MLLASELQPVNKSNDYDVKLELFEGPLDLLLYLVNKAEVNIVDISVSEIAKQYLKHLDLMRELNINVASEYLSMAATLVRLKAHELLPESEVEAIEDEEGIFNRQQLIEKLLEYKKFKEAANSFRVIESEHLGSFSRGRQEEIETVATTEDPVMESVTLFDLISAFQNVLDRYSAEDQDEQRTIAPETVRLDDRIEYILGRIEDEAEIPFVDLFSEDRRKLVLIVTFMAILELVKMKKVQFRQEKQLGDLYIKKRLEKKKIVEEKEKQ